MTSSNSTAYIKKLVKIVYEKEKEIQAMKRVLKEKHVNVNEQNLQVEIHPALKRELECTSGQLREVSLQMLSMQAKMRQLSSGLEDQIAKNAKLALENAKLTNKNNEIIQAIAALTQANAKLEEENVKFSEQYANILEKNREFIEKLEKTTCQEQGYQLKLDELSQQLQQSLIREKNVSDLVKTLNEKIDTLKQSEEKQRMKIFRYQTQITQYKLQQAKLIRQSKSKENQALANFSEVQRLKSKLELSDNQIQRLTATNEKTKQNFIKLTNQYNEIKIKLQNLQENYDLKESQYYLLNQTLKDYEQFAFEISQYIEAAYAKHCCHGMLRSSKKLIRQAESCTSKFESALCKLSQLQVWMDNTAEKLQKIIQEYELPNQTLQNLSIIAHSFEEKLQLCDLTERIEKEKEEMDKNEEILLDNLQKEIQKSKLIEKSKLMELDEVREVLKVTKDINRELMDEINGKQYIISQCRKLYGQVIGTKSSPELKQLRKLLNLKN